MYFKIKLGSLILVIYDSMCVNFMSQNIVYLWRKWPQDSQHENFKMRLKPNKHYSLGIVKFKFLGQFKAINSLCTEKNTVYV